MSAAPFRDLAEGGRALARELERFRGTDAIVLAIVRGGVSVGVEVARHLELPLELIIRTQLMMSPEGESMGASNVAGRLRLHPAIAPAPAVPQTPLEHFLAGALADLERRVTHCRGDRAAIDIGGRTAIVVDSGIRATGMTHIAVRTVRALGATRVIAACPVGSPESRAAAEALADETICVTWLPLGNVAMGYSVFDPPEDEQIAALL